MNLHSVCRAVPMKNIELRDPFWSPVQETVRTEMLPYQWEALNDRIPNAEPSRCVANFEIAAGRKQGRHGGFVFQDSDLAKWLEAVAYTLVRRKDAALEKKADETIELVCAAQQPDGYLNTFYILNGLDKRFTNLKDNHELYCLGHMTEAAVAYYEATGKDRLLKAVVRCVDLVDSLIGPEEGKLHGYPGHEILEMALVRLYRVTGDRKHLRLAGYFIDERGREPLFFEEERKRNGLPTDGDRAARNRYHQADRPVREQTEAEGHAVRAVYLYSGMADVARETGDASLAEACRRLWTDMTRRQMYVTGGIGSTHHGEAFSFDYDLPNDTAYAETCASVGLVFFARRMLELDPRAEYADVMEQALYNGVISGMSLDGKRFFYVNPLEASPAASEKEEDHRHVKLERQKWFGCACCPPNLARLLSSLGGYVCTASEGTLYQNLYVGGTVSVEMNGVPVRVELTSAYPWKGGVSAVLHPEKAGRFSYALRIPGWCESFSLLLNGENAPYRTERGYAVLDRVWQDGDTVSLSLSMPVRRVFANPRVREDIGKVAVARGPLVYCLEEEDNGSGLQRIFLPDGAAFEERRAYGLPEEITALVSEGFRLSDEDWPDNKLYGSRAPSFEPCTLTWIPYYAWANRSPGEMTVWAHRLP